jgi:hypothetical protein
MCLWSVQQPGARVYACANHSTGYLEVRPAKHIFSQLLLKGANDLSPPREHRKGRLVVVFPAVIVLGRCAASWREVELAGAALR